MKVGIVGGSDQANMMLSLPQDGEACVAHKISPYVKVRIRFVEQGIPPRGLQIRILRDGE
jgi:hypothetical protein